MSSNEIFFYMIFVLTIHLSDIFADVKSLPFCTKHFNEIISIREDSANALEKANKEGGGLFNHSIVFTPHEAAMYFLKGKYTYTQFKEVFLKFISQCQPSGLSALYLGQTKMTDSFLNLYDKCILFDSNLAAYYERGKIYFDKGMYEECINNIQPLIESGKLSLSDVDLKDDSVTLLLQGISQLESNEYDEAINTLSSLIKKDPNNKEAFFNRASAYFETGNFDLALSDYLKSEKFKNFSVVESKVSDEFSSALLDGLLEGGKEAATEFIPSLCDSAYGLGESLWAFINEPVNSTTNFSNACYDVSEAVFKYAKTIDKEKIKEMANEVQVFCNKYNRLKDGEKGQMIGHCIGKYGVDIFVGGASIKCISAVKNLKYANRIANLEALASSAKSQEALKAAALNHSARRDDFFKEIKIHWDRQNKHVPGKHNYIIGRSTFEHSDPQYLLEKFAGTGKPIKNRIVGNSDYREKVNFGEFIGYHVEETTGLKTPTTWVKFVILKQGSYYLRSSIGFYDC